MAEKRMFSKSIIDSDAFLEMPATSQLLYFHLSMRADDDGFINKPKSIMKMIGAKDDDINILFARKFVIPFESGVVVIKHWRINNYIRNDTYHETNYKEEKAMLELDENNAYKLSVTSPLRVSNEVTTQISIDKNRLDKNSKEKINIPDGLQNSFNAFKEMRNKIKKPLTDNAIKLLLSKLDSMASDDDTKCKILDQSTLNDWQGIYPLKDEPKKKVEDYKNMYEVDY